MTKKEKKPVIKEVEAPAIEPVYIDKTTGAPTKNINKADLMPLILQGMLDMQAQTNATLEKLSEKIDNIAAVPTENTSEPKTQEEMMRELNSKKIIERKMYKVLIIKNVIPMNAQDQQLHGENFSNWGIVRGDTNKRFDSEAEAKAYWDKLAPGKYKLMPVTVPVPEWQDYKVRRPNLTM